MKVQFYHTTADEKLKFVVIVSRYKNQWIFCKHRDRTTYELPGGHREKGEMIMDSARRELEEETGAVKYQIEPVCVYSVTGKNRVNHTGEEMFGMLCFAKVESLNEKLYNEIEKIYLFDDLPENLTYPDIQPELFYKVMNHYKEKQISKWFESWFEPTWNQFEDIFSQDVYYSESWGPEYRGIQEIKKWFRQWQQQAYLLKWDIKKIIHKDKYSVIEWNFACNDHQKIHEFDGLTLLEWNHALKIKSLKEFALSLPKYRPFQS